MSSLTAIALEKHMLGAICSSHGAVLDEYPITLDHFTDPDNVKLFKFLASMHRSGIPISEYKVQDMIQDDRIEFSVDMKDALHCRSLDAVPDLWQVLNGYAIKRGAVAIGEWLTRAEGDDVVEEAIQRLLGLKIDAGDEDVFGKELDVEFERFQSLRRGEKQRSIRTPFEVWNDAFGGIIEGSMYALSGRPGAGKNAMIEQMIEKMITEDRPVLMFAKDMSPGMMIKRLVCRRAKVPYWRFVRDVVHDNEMDAMVDAFTYYKGVRERKLLRVMNPSSLTAERLSSIVRHDLRVYGTECVFLDHFATLKLGKTNVVEGLTMASIELRRMVNETKVPLVVLAHINRQGANGKPTAEDIKYCDQLYGDADGMAMLWTDQDRTDLKYGENLKMYMTIAKNRCGPLGDEPIMFDGNNLTFHNEN